MGILTSVSQTAGFRFLEVLAACWRFQFLDPSQRSVGGYVRSRTRSVLDSILVKMRMGKVTKTKSILLIIRIIIKNINRFIYIYTRHCIQMCVYFIWYVFITELQSSANSCDFRMLHVFLCIFTLWIETKSIHPNQSNRPNESVV